MRVSDVADLLHVSEKKVLSLIDRDGLPARKVTGHWRFHPDEVFRWMSEHHFPGLSRERWREIERGRARRTAADPTDEIVGPRIPPGGVRVDLAAKTKPSVIRELVDVAESTEMVYDREGVLAALLRREDVSPTAVDGGVALPHPHEPLPYSVADSICIVGRTLRPIPFGAPDGRLTDLFFLSVCLDSSSHLHLLARISRMIRTHGLADALREAEDAETARRAIETAENNLVLELSDE